MARVFVTGASGSVGAAASHALLGQGHQVAVLVRQKDPVRLADILPQLTVIHGDLQDVPAFRPGLAVFAPEALVHAAWLGVQGAFRDDPKQDQNLIFARDLMALASDLKLKQVVALGSQAEYGPHSGALDENASTHPNTRYGQTKLECCRLMLRLAENQGLPLAWLRLFSAYGPGDDPSWMIQSVIRQLLAGQRPALTPGEQRWDYLYLADVGSAVAAVLKSGSSGIFNLGSGTAIRLRELVEQLRDLIDPSLPLDFGKIPYGPGQVMHLEADIHKLTHATGWQPKMSLAQGLARCVEAARTRTN
jgi:UDP-glucose 4-epimerase